MRWPEEQTNPFPSRHRQEPAGLRADILDELADHLALSADHEMEHNGQTPPAAWARALDRFGDPDAVARRLWWDAMKGKIMRDWIQTGVSAVSAIVVVLVAVYVVMNMQAMQTTQAQLAETLQRMDSRAQSAAGETLNIEVRRGKPDGPPAVGVEVVLEGKVNGDSNASVSLKTDATGHAKFHPVPQGNYTLEITDPQSLMRLRADHSLFAGLGATRQFLAPDFAAVQTRVATNPPLLYPNDRMVTSVDYWGELSVGDCRWRTDGLLLVGNTGLYVATRKNGRPQFDEKLAPVPFLMLPPVELSVGVRPKLRDPNKPFDNSITAVRPGRPDNPPRQQIKLTANQENTVTLELTEEQVQTARQQAMGYTQRKWLPDSDLNTPVLDAYVAAAFRIEDAKRVYCEKTGDDKTTITLPASGKGPDAEAKDYGADWLMLHIADPANLAKTYPPECRFVLVSCRIDSAEVFPWTDTACTHEAGQPFPISLGQTPAAEAATNIFRADVTAFIRGDAASAPCAGVLLHASAAQLNTITPALVNQEGKNCVPYLLVLRDTPPDDL
jgi:hypothetical protein